MRGTETVYADTLFLVNFAMDLLSLGITGKVLRCRMKRGRITAAAVIGGVYGVAAVLMEGYAWIGVLIGAAVQALMCYIAFDRRAAAGMAVLTAVDFLLGGGITAMWSALGRIRGVETDPARTQARIGGGIPLGWLAVLAGVCALAAVLADRIGRRRRFAAEVPLMLRYEGRVWQGEGMVDTGNLLEDPVSGTPVVLLPREEGGKLFAEPLLPVLVRNEPSALASLPHTAAKRVRVVPMHTPSSFSLLLAASPDGARVGEREEELLVALSDVPRPLVPASLAMKGEMR